MTMTPEQRQRDKEAKEYGKIRRGKGTDPRGRKSTCDNGIGVKVQAQGYRGKDTEAMA